MKQGGGELNELEISSWFFSDKKKELFFIRRMSVEKYYYTVIHKWHVGQTEKSTTENVLVLVSYFYLRALIWRTEQTFFNRTWWRSKHVRVVSYCINMHNISHLKNRNIFRMLKILHIHYSPHLVARSCIFYYCATKCVVVVLWEKKNCVTPPRWWTDEVEISWNIFSLCRRGSSSLTKKAVFYTKNDAVFF